jgi:O-antigen/teichoic acid export membrane protein
MNTPATAAAAAVGVAAPAARGRLPRLLANTGWNLTGQLVPLLVGLAVLPALIRALGLDRYGFLTLVWVLVGYASVFDFGIGRVLVRVVALRLARGDEAGAHHMARVGMTFLGLFGVLVGALFALGSGWLVANVVKIPPELQEEALNAMWLLAASIPFVMITTGYAGVLSAYQQFRGQNLLRATMGVASYLGPLLVALWLNRLDALVAFILVMRATATVAHAWLARRNCHYAFRPLLPDAPSTNELFALGGWVSVSNVVGPILSYLDRLLLGALVPVRMVAFYATPFDLVSRASILPYSMMSALFPTAAAVEPGSEAARRLMLNSMRQLYVLMLPVVFLLIVAARPGLHAWLGEEFAERGTLVMQLLAVGVFLNTLAQSPATLIQAAGQPRVMALLHLAELPVFVVLLYAFTVQWGIVGTAAAACLRSSADALAVLLLAARDLPQGLAAIPWRGGLLPAAVAAALGLLGTWPASALEAALVLLAGLALFVVYAWSLLLLPSERQRLLGLLKVAP